MQEVRSVHGGRHELGQNFLVHAPTLDSLTALVASAAGPVIEIGAGDGALTRRLAALGRPLTAIELDEHRVRRLRVSLPAHVRVEHGDAMVHPMHAPVLVGNLPFHLTTPILRRLLRLRAWREAIVLTQWEVARKRAGVGGRTLMSAQAGPWFEFELHGRVPARGFRPAPSVDGGILRIRRREESLVPSAAAGAYRDFAHRVFTGRGGALPRILQRATGRPPHEVRAALAEAGAVSAALPRDLDPEQWALLFTCLGPRLTPSRCR
ncbi:23S ribosomal RNA methyltransferase Erm [Brevibacterium album]|uniref:23S ribosomal RNA methyltransferase Erm n=1 Tax=Brevibacterium album TaxID=417948 RepID=UPI0003FCB9AA|nr:23S ribosomal RNA methyltransferase Erm [Brevibacterium album]